MAQIKFQDKQTLSINPSIPDVNKVKSDDMNEIKDVVNENDTNVGDLSNLNTTNKTSIVNAINEVNTNQINSSTYSTNEIVIGTWLGKPLYRKVIDFGTLPDAGFKNVAHGIENFEDMTKIIAVGKSSTGSSYPIPLVGNGSIFSGATATIRVDATNVTIATTTNISAHTAMVILEYTKTTN